jgi:hypothetical protein
MNPTGLFVIPQVDLFLFALLVASGRVYGFRRQASSIWLLLASLLTLTLGLSAAMNAVAEMIMTAISHYTKNATYDFNAYSVMLIGGATVWLGWKLIRVSGCVARGDRQAWRKSARYTAALLAVVSPMAPFQPMAYAGIAMGFISLAGLEMARTALSNSEKACAEHVPARRSTWTEVRA